MQVIAIKSERERVREVRKILRSVGNSIGSVHFRKRSDGSKRRMSYRIRVSKPTYAAIPTGKMENKWRRDMENNLMTVFSVNTVRYNKKGKMCGRGDYRSVPLENVDRICVKVEIYKIVR